MSFSSRLANFSYVYCRILANASKPTAVTISLMRTRRSLTLFRSPYHGLRPAQTPLPRALCLAPSPSTTPHRSLAQVRSDRDIPEIWFTSSRPPLSVLFEIAPGTSNDGGAPPPDERTLKLGKSMPSLWSSRLLQPYCLSMGNANKLPHTALQILQARLPSLLASPLPPEILSPHITLHLFPPLAASPIMPHSGPHLWHGVACPSSETSSS